MEPTKKMASEAAATAPEARDIMPLKKPTTRPSGKLRAGARPSLRAAIDAMCRTCIYDPGSGSGGWREQVRACSSGNCPLHPVRPLPVRATKTGRKAPQANLVTVSVAAVASALPATKIGHNDHTPNERRAA